MRNWYPTYQEARDAALATYPNGKLKRTTSRTWLGNSMGHSPATYAIINQYGRELAHIWSGCAGDGWTVTLTEKDTT